MNEQAKIEESLIDSVRHKSVNEFSEFWLKNSELDINRSLQDNFTLLMYACQERKIDFVNYLLDELNADANVCCNGWTALMLACYGTYDYGFSSEYSSQSDETVLQIVKKLIECNAIINVSNFNGKTAFMFAAANGLINVVRFLLENNVSLEACDNEKKTAIFYAVEENQYDVTKVLIDAGAIIDCHDYQYSTPKMIAQHRGYEDIEKLFPVDEETEFVPTEYQSYNTYMELIPTAFPHQQSK